MAIEALTQEDAQRFARTVDSAQAFVATIMSPSMGARAAQLTSVEMVNGFLQAYTIDDFKSVGLRLDIHYVDFGFLAQWLDEVIGDAGLAAEIRALHETGEAFGLLVHKVKEVLEERLVHYRVALGEEQAEEQLAESTV